MKCEDAYSERCMNECNLKRRGCGNIYDKGDFKKKRDEVK